MESKVTYLPSSSSKEPKKKSSISSDSELSELHEIYSTLDLTHHVEFVEKDQQTKLLIHEDYEKLTPFARIEKMVEELQLSSELAFNIMRTARGKLTLEKRAFSRYYDDAKTVLEVHDEGYFYSPRMQVFFDSLASSSSLGIDLKTFELGQPLQVCPSSGWYYADIFNELLETAYFGAS